MQNDEPIEGSNESMDGVKPDVKKEKEEPMEVGGKAVDIESKDDSELDEVKKGKEEPMEDEGKVLGVVAKKPVLDLDELDISNALRNHTVYRKIPYRSRLEGLLEIRSKQHLEKLSSSSRRLASIPSSRDWSKTRRSY